MAINIVSFSETPSVITTKSSALRFIDLTPAALNPVSDSSLVLYVNDIPLLVMTVIN
ncbi:Uncharacterised protein [Staphylococcus aureus]|nr:Uncharacterised protein [Staphylococcus aureus]